MGESATSYRSRTDAVIEIVLYRSFEDAEQLQNKKEKIQQVCSLSGDGLKKSEEFRK